MRMMFLQVTPCSVWSEKGQCLLYQIWVSAGQARPREHLTPARAVNHYGDIESSTTNQIMFDNGKKLAYGHLDELQDPER
jgi:hypothetical protein